MLFKITGTTAAIGVAAAATAAGTYFYSRWTQDEKDERTEGEVTDVEENGYNSDNDVYLDGKKS